MPLSGEKSNIEVGGVGRAEELVVMGLNRKDAMDAKEGDWFLWSKFILSPLCSSVPPPSFATMRAARLRRTARSVVGG